MNTKTIMLLALVGLAAFVAYQAMNKPPTPQQTTPGSGFNLGLGFSRS